MEIRATMLYKQRDPKIERTPKFWSIKYRVSPNEKRPTILNQPKSKIFKKQKQSEAPNNRNSTIKSWEIEHQKPSNGRSKKNKTHKNRSSKQIFGTIGLKQTSLNTSNSQYINIKPTKKKLKLKQ